MTLVLVKRRQVLRATAPGSPGTDGRPGPQDGREPFAPGTGTRAWGGVPRGYLSLFLFLLKALRI